MQRTVLSTFLIIAIWLAYDAFFVLRSGQLALVGRLGSPPRAVTEPGIHLKAPFVSQLELIDGRLRFFESEPLARKGPDGRNENVRLAIAYRVTDVAAFSRTLENEDRLEARLVDFARASVTDEPPASAVRADLASAGVQIAAVSTTHVEPTASDRERALSAMRAEEERLARVSRSEAELQAAEIRARAQNERAALLAGARAAAAEQRAKADAEAAAIYATAYARDPDLAEFLQALEVYESSFDEGDELVLSTHSTLLRHLTP
jgi:membrane protease subunit HflC